MHTSLLHFSAMVAVLGHLNLVLGDPFLTINDIPFSTRAFWMRKANEALFNVHGDPCPFAAFGTVIVNHTADGLGEAVCIGANSGMQTGNPVLHGTSTDGLRFYLQSSSLMPAYQAKLQQSAIAAKYSQTRMESTN